MGNEQGPLMIPNVRHQASTEVTALWREYRHSGDPRLRERLVLSLAPLVKYIVGRQLPEAPAGCETDDFVSCGLEALVQCIDRYDPVGGATLEQYAWTRIHGAVLDELRRQDWAPRSVRRWERDIDRADEAFTVLHGRPPGTRELADALAITPAALREHREEIARSDVTSLNTLVRSEDDTAVERLDALPSADRGCDPEHRQARTEAKEKFRVAFSALPRREREVAVLLYVENLTLLEAGAVLGVSASRVSQLHRNLKRKLRAALKAESGLFDGVV